jgi:hypothetical protein
MLGGRADRIPCVLCCHHNCCCATQAIATQPLELPGDVNISTHLRDLFMRLFDKDPNTRITLQVSTHTSSTLCWQQAPLLHSSCKQGRVRQHMWQS